MRAARSWLCAVAVALASGLAAPALAAGSLADREAARSIAGKAYELFEAGDYRRAIDLFRQADARFHAPTHSLYVARAQAKMGQLIEAKGTYERVLEEKLAADAPPPFKEAQANARTELVEVQARTPSLVVSLASPAPPGASVVIDGEPLAADDVGRALARNPGTHLVSAEAPGMVRVERAVILAAGGGEQRVALLLAPPASASVVPAVIAFVAGAAALGAGTTGAVLLRHAASGKTTGLRALEIAGFAGGGVGVGAGILLLALRARTPSSSPSSSPPSSPTSSSAATRAPSVDVRVGLGSLSVVGEF
jgi:hypothetical protein